MTERKRNLTAKALAGIRWNYISTIVSFSLQIGFTAILARLLEPTAYGIMGMSDMVMNFIGYFAACGIGSALIQKKELTSEDIHASFFLTLSLGGLFYLFVYCAAPLGSQLMKASGLTPVLRVMGLNMILISLSAIPVSLLTRKMNFRALFVVNLVSYIAGACLAVNLARNHFGVWSLVSAQLMQSSVSTIAALLFLRHRIWGLFSATAIMKILTYGWRVSLTGFMEFIGSNVDKIFIGRNYGSAALGIYGRSRLLIDLSVQNTYSSIAKTLFPSFSAIQHDKTKLKSAYATGSILCNTMLLPLCWWVFMSAGEIIMTIFGEKWAAGIPFLKMFSVIAIFDYGSNLGLVLCQAIAKLNAKMIFQCIYVCFITIAVSLISPKGVMFIVEAVLLANVVRFIYFQLLIRNIIGFSFKEVMEMFYPGLVISALLIAAIYILKAIFVNHGSAVLLTMELLSGGAIFAIGALIRPPKKLKEAWVVLVGKLEPEDRFRNIIEKCLGCGEK